MHVMRIFACFPTHNAQEKSRTRLSSSFSSFIGATVEVVRALDMVRDVSSVMRVEGLN